MTVPAVPDRVSRHARLMAEIAAEPQWTDADAKAMAIESAFRRRTLDEVYGYDAESIARLSPHAISPARLAGV